MARKTPEDFPRSLSAHYTTEFFHPYFSGNGLFLGQKLPSDKTENTETSLQESNVKALTDRGIPVAKAQGIVHSLRILVTGGRPLLSAFLYNDFLAEPRDENFGEFLDKHWDRIHRDIQSYSFPFHRDTNAVFTIHEFYNFALTYKAQGHPEARATLEALTQDEVRLLVSGNLSIPVAKPSVVSSVIKSTLDKHRGTFFKNPTIDQVRNVFYKAYAKSIVATDESVGYALHELGGTAAQVCSSCYKAMFQDPLKQNIGEISSIDAMAYARFILANAEELGPKKLIVLIHLLNEPTLFGMGHKRPLRDVLIRMSKEENALELLLALADLSLFYTKPLPTVKDWEAGLAEGIEAFGSGELLAELVTDTDKTDVGEREAQQKLQRLIGL